MEVILTYLSAFVVAVSVLSSPPEVEALDDASPLLAGVDSVSLIAPKRDYSRFVELDDDHARSLLVPTCHAWSISTYYLFFCYYFFFLLIYFVVIIV